MIRSLQFALSTVWSKYSIPCLASNNSGIFHDNYLTLIEQRDDRKEIKDVHTKKRPLYQPDPLRQIVEPKEASNFPCLFVMVDGEFHFGV